MIKFSLQCDAGHGFEGWFRNSEDFDSQKQRGFLQCPTCGSEHISKALMAPAISGTRTQDKIEQPAGRTPIGPAPVDVPSVPAPATASASASASAPVPAPAQPMVLPTETEKQAELVQKLRDLREKVVANSDYVGDKFAEEARKMHFNETEKRGIYGEATLEEVKDLNEDGIDCLPLPILLEDQN